MGAADSTESRTQSTDGASEQVIAVRTQESELRAIRTAVERFVADHGGDPELADDFKLVACELATNVMQHSDADMVTVSMRRRAGSWELDVSDAGGAPDLDDVAPPSTDSVSGRGLMIVRGLMDEVSVVERDGDTFIRCVRHVA